MASLDDEANCEAARTLAAILHDEVLRFTTYSTCTSLAQGIYALWERLWVN